MSAPSNAPPSLPPGPVVPLDSELSSAFASSVDESDESLRDTVEEQKRPRQEQETRSNAGEKQQLPAIVVSGDNVRIGAIEERDEILSQITDGRRASAHCNQRYFFPVRAGRSAQRVGIKSCNAINKEQVTMVTVMEQNLNRPAAVRLAFHGGSFQIPIIEVACQSHFFSVGGETAEVNGLDGFFGG